MADGYAVNFLFRKKLAEPATEDKITQVETQKAARVEEARREEEALDKKIAMLRGKKVTITARATEKGGLFKAIGEKDALQAIRAEHSLELPPSSITFPEPIKTLGEHRALLSSKNEKTEIVVSVSAA